MTTDFASEKQQASAWFRHLRDDIVAAFEKLEREHADGPLADAEPGAFEVTETTRASEDGSDAGGGLMSVMRGGRVFEKVGVNISTVFGTLGAQAQNAMAARKGIPGMKDDPRFWASGISLVAHMQNPHVPAVHMNTRMFWTPHAWWFGGGSDLNPCIEYADDTAHFHAQQKAHLDPHGTDLYPRLKEWADTYFYIPHRHRARGVGGIFMDDHCTGDWSTDFTLTQDIGRAFLPAYVPLVEARKSQSWTEADKDAQLVHRGLYAEYNLVYDRGTKFGLETGHDANAVLMSLPPLAKWPEVGRARAAPYRLRHQRVSGYANRKSRARPCAATHAQGLDPFLHRRQSHRNARLKSRLTHRGAKPRRAGSMCRRPRWPALQWASHTSHQGRSKTHALRLNGRLWAYHGSPLTRMRLHCRRCAAQCRWRLGQLRATYRWDQLELRAHRPFATG